MICRETRKEKLVNLIYITEKSLTFSFLKFYASVVGSVNWLTEPYPTIRRFLFLSN